MWQGNMANAIEYHCSWHSTVLWNKHEHYQMDSNRSTPTISTFGTVRDYKYAYIWILIYIYIYALRIYCRMKTPAIAGLETELFGDEKTTCGLESLGYMKISEASRISCAISETLRLRPLKKPFGKCIHFHFHRLFTFTFTARSPHLQFANGATNVRSHGLEESCHVILAKRKAQRSKGPQFCAYIKSTTMLPCGKKQ